MTGPAQRRVGRRRRTAAAAAIAGALPFAAAAAPPPAGPPPVTHGRITGIGGVFVRSRDPKALAAWYQRVLGLSIEAWGGALLQGDDPARPPVAVWTPMGPQTGEMAPSTREVMLDFAVDDLDAFLARISANGAAVIGRSDAGALGRFAWIMDPDGTKIEFWEPKRPPGRP